MFMYVENEIDIVFLETHQLINMSTGNTIVGYDINGYNYTKRDTDYKIDQKIYTFKVYDKDSIYYDAGKYKLAFKKIKEAKKAYDMKKLSDFIFKNPIKLFYEDGTNNDVIKMYGSNGRLILQRGENIHTEISNYRLINFQGFLFIQGITSAPKLIEEIKKGALIGKELDDRYKQKNIEFRKTKMNK